MNNPVKIFIFVIVTVIVLKISSTTVVVAAASLLLEITFWPEMKTKEQRDKNSKRNEKQRSQKNSIIHDNTKMVQIL